MTRTITLYIKDILENIEDAEEFVEGMDYEEFIKDKKTNRAVLRCIEVIGEAAKHIPESIRQRYPQLPWRDMAGYGRYEE